MTGRSQLPSGAPRKASQRHSRRGGAVPVRIETTWRAGDKVRWRDRTGIYRRHVDAENVEIVIGERVYRVRRSELRPG